MFAFASGAWLAMALASILSVFVGRAQDHEWGAWGSMQVLWWVALAPAFFGMVAFTLGANVARVYPATRWCLALGVACGALACVLGWGANVLSAKISTGWVVVGAVPVLAFLAPRVFGRFAPAEPEPAEP
ncbi:hypothetical protein IP84_10400 [beta proteobacterium AAP99]|nr:hypothetical protein IP84_10400 [beta proteobacterium AAP99]